MGAGASKESPPSGRAHDSGAALGQALGGAAPAAGRSHRRRLLSPRPGGREARLFGILWGPIQPAFRDELFGFLPDWVRQPFGFEDPGRFSSGALVTTAVLFVALNGIIGPTVEELYFRGHLLPRIDRLGAWAPVLNASLFTLYHLWSPWQLPVRVLQTLPFIYLVWRKRSLYLGLVVHCLMNTIGAVGVVPRMLSGA